MNALDKFFHISERHSTLGREVRGGVATFLTMAYILLVNPSILSAAGMPAGAVATSTALAAGLCSILMGLWANFPLGLASGMGVNAIVAFQLASQTGSWQTAMGLVVIDGLIVVALVMAGLREAVLDAIPKDLRLAIGAGIGLFIAFIGLQNGGLITAHAKTLVTHGDFHAKEPLIALGGLILIAILMMRRVTGSILIGVAACTVAALVLSVTKLPEHMPGPDFGVMFHADVKAAAQWKYLPMIMALVLIDFFDTLGTASAVAEEGGLIDDRGRIPGVRRILLVDGVAASVGGALGASSVTAYIESASGVAEGARTGLHSVVVGVLFLLAIIAAPFAGVIPACATAPALILVGFLMMTHIAEIKFRNYETAIPAFLTVLMIPLTFSIAHGIGYGMIAQVILSIANGNARKIHPMLYVVAAAFVWFFAAGV
ncbi:MAG: Xanthine/uracil/vitamin permease [Phycisphaerales bacterium]|nr:Xanthine/uracil/vitamin permease [Phycisphaerales bacterium]